MDNANEHFTYPWIFNPIIHVQLDELVYFNKIQKENRKNTIDTWK